MLHGIHCIKSCCIKSTAFNRVPFFTVHGIHCIQSRCMESTAFNRYDLSHAACNPLHSIGMLWAMLHKIHCFKNMLYGIHCIQSRFMESSAFNRDAFDHAAWSTLHSITMHGIHCIPSGCFGRCCIKSTAFNRDALGLAAWTPLHTIGIHCATMHGILCIQ